MEKYSLLIDLSSAQPNEGIMVNGGGQYAENIFYYLINEFASTEIFCLLNGNKGKNKKLLSFLVKHNIASREYSSLKELQDILNNVNYNTAFLPVCYPEYSKLKIHRDKRLVTTIHDLSSVYADEWGFIEERYINSVKMNLKQLVKYTMLAPFVKRRHIVEHSKICDLTDNQVVVTVSEYSKQQLIKYSKKNINPIVLYPYLFEKNCCDYPIPNEKDYFFLVGGNRWHKNNYFVVRTIDDLISQNEKMSKTITIIAGMDEAHINFYKKKIKHLENFRFKGYISKQEYFTYLNHAKAFIYPSLFEGFGAPPIEAMGINTLTLCSNSTCIPEICSNASIYFSPTDQKSLIAALNQSFDIGIASNKIKFGSSRFDYIFNKQNADLKILIQILKQK